MTQVSAVMPAPPDVASGAVQQPAVDLKVLPEPQALAMPPQDIVTMMMALLEELNQMSVSQSEARLTNAQQQVKEQLDKLLEQVARALQAAKQAHEKKESGWFSDLVGSVADVAGTIAGTAVDFAKDTVTLPCDVAVSIAEGQDVMSVLKAEIKELVSNGDTADTVKGFTTGVLKFEAAVIEFTVNLRIALVEAAASGKSVWETVKEDADKLWNSFETEILNNPQFWEAAGWIAKGVSVALAGLSGGALGWVAVGVFLLCEADARYGLAQKAFGEDVAPWVSLGMRVASAVLMGIASAGSENTLQIIKGTVGLAAGSVDVYQGIRQMQEGERQAKALEREADIKETLNRMQRLQRLIDDLLEALEEEGDSRKTNMNLGTQSAQTQAAMVTAAVMRV